MSDEEELQDRSGLSELRERDGGGGAEDAGREGRFRELHGAQDERGLRGGAGPCGRDGGGSAELQEGRGRLRDIR